MPGLGPRPVGGEQWRSCADVLELKTGQKIDAPVLKEASDALYVDLGFDVVRVPMAAINKRASQGGCAGPRQRDGSGLLSDRPAAGPHGERAGGHVRGGSRAGADAGRPGLGLYHQLPRLLCHELSRDRAARRGSRSPFFIAGAGGEFVRRRIDDVKILALNPFLDLALLQIPEQPDFKFRPVYLSHDDDQKEGDEVFAIGNPLGLERSVSRGIVSTRNRSFQGLVYIQTTTQINPGNSGGPLFNARGEVVGVTNMKAVFGEGIGFAIPVSYLKHFLENRDSFAFDKNNPNTGYRYLDPPRPLSAAGEVNANVPKPKP